MVATRDKKDLSGLQWLSKNSRPHLCHEKKWVDPKASAVRFVVETVFECAVISVRVLNFDENKALSLSAFGYFFASSRRKTSMNMTDCKSTAEERSFSFFTGFMQESGQCS
jgi:hypothetical protein